MPKPINFTHFNPASPSIFKTDRNERERVTVYFCENSEHCDAYKNKKCLMLAGLYGSRCPYGSIHREEGFTKMAKNCGQLIANYKKKYGDVAYQLKALNTICNIGDYIYVPLAYASSCKTPIRDREFFVVSDSSFFVMKKSDFTPEFVVELLQYTPRAWMGGTITQYQEKELPQFAFQLNRNMPEMYQKVLEIYPEIEGYLNQITCVGKIAKVQTLLPGTVKLGSVLWDWNGKTLSTAAKGVIFMPSSKNITDEIISFEPGENVLVEIVNNGTVSEDTVFEE